VIFNYFASTIHSTYTKILTQNFERNNANSSIDMIYKLDAKGCYTYANDVTAETLGTTAKELKGQFYLNFVYKAHQARVQQFYQEQMQRQMPSTYYEFRLAPIKGRLVWIGQTVNLLYENNELVEVVVVAHDITEKILAKQQAANSEEKYRNIIENINLGLMEVDLDEKIVFANDSFCKMMGYELEEILGKNASSIFLEDSDVDQKARIQSANSKRTEGKASAYEIRIRRKDGTPVWLIISGAPVRNSSGEVIGSLGIHNDITERKEQELQRQELLEELSSRNEQLYAQQNYLKAINDFAARLLGASGVEGISSEITEYLTGQLGFEDCAVYLMDTEGGPLKLASSVRPREHKGKYEIPEQIGLAEGIVGAVAASGVSEVVRDTRNDERYLGPPDINRSEIAVPIIADGEVIGVIDSEHPRANFFTAEHLQTFITVANLSASRLKSVLIRQMREEAEMALKDSETRLRSVINSSLDAIITIDEEGCVQEWNNQAQEIFGYKRREVMGKSLSTLIIPEKFREAHERGMKHFLASGEGPVLNQRIEIHAEHKNGNYFPVELSIVPVRMNRQYLFSAFLRDITMRKKAENDMEEALQKQTELNELKSRLISMTSHEFRTPLTTIQSNVDLISFILEKENVGSAVVNKNLERINFEIARLNNMVNDILMAGKLESGNFSFKPVEVDLVNFCHDTIAQSFAYQRDGRVAKVVVNGNPRPVLVDKGIYSHIITNLLSNAFKYSEGEPSPELHLTYTDDKLELLIKDYGIGIPFEDQERLFESFFRAGNAGAIKGNGMGLNIVKQFVELHGADIKVLSTEGEGTEVTITHNIENSNKEE
jgi:PAS domain S-box-containing protein